MQFGGNKRIKIKKSVKKIDKIAFFISNHVFNSQKTATIIYLLLGAISFLITTLLLRIHRFIKYYEFNYYLF